MQSFIAIMAVAATAAYAQTYPGKPIRLIVPYVAGTGVDTLARTLAEALGKRLGQPVVVENKPGASGNIGSEFVAKSPPDGYTVLLASNTFTILPALSRTQEFDPVRDFTTIGQTAVGTLVLVVHPSLGVASATELIALAKRRPGQLNYASPGNGTPHHMVMELLKQTAEIDIVHVSYKGSTGAVIDVVSGRVPIMFLGMSIVLPQVASGKLKALAVLGERRSPQAPDVPTLREAGIDIDAVELWYGLLAPARTPRDIVDRLQREVAAVLAQADIRDALIKQGLTPTAGTPEEFTAMIKAEVTTWRKVVSAGKITLD